MKKTLFVMTLCSFSLASYAAPLAKLPEKDLPNQLVGKKAATKSTASKSVASKTALPAKTQQALQQFAASYRKIQAALKTATPKQADQLLLKHAAEVGRLLEKLDQADKHYLQQQIAKEITVGTDSQIVKKSPKFVAREKQVAPYHVRYEYYDVVGRGYFTLEKNYFSKLFKGKLSPAATQYLNLRDKHDENVVVYDNEFVLPYEIAGEYVYDWEQYLQKYGKSSFAKQAKCNYMEMQQFFMLGGTNYVGMKGITLDPYVAPNKQVLDPEVKQAWKNFRKKYPKSPTSTIIAQIPNKPPYTTKIETLVKNYQQRTGVSALNLSQCEDLNFR